MEAYREQKKEFLDPKGSDNGKAKKPKKRLHSLQHVAAVDSMLRGSIKKSVFKPEQLPVLVSELQLMRYMSSAGRIAEVGSAWRAEFLPGSTIVRQVGQEGTWLSLGCVGVTTVPMLPVEKVGLPKGVTVWQVKAITTAAEIRWVPILDFKDWQVVPFFFASPVYFQAKLKVLPHPMPDCCMVQDGDAVMPLLKYAAECAFWNLPLSMMKKCC